MSLFRYLSNLLVACVLAISCSNLVRGSEAVHTY